MALHDYYYYYYCPVLQQILRLTICFCFSFCSPFSYCSILRLCSFQSKMLLAKIWFYYYIKRKYKSNANQLIKLYTIVYGYSDRTGHVSLIWLSCCLLMNRRISSYQRTFFFSSCKSVNAFSICSYKYNYINELKLTICRLWHFRHKVSWTNANE